MERGVLTKRELKDTLSVQRLANGTIVSGGTTLSTRFLRQFVMSRLLQNTSQIDLSWYTRQTNAPVAAPSIHSTFSPSDR